jgi:tetratricopeptide (TPR) repeat protein
MPASERAKIARDLSDLGASVFTNSSNHQLSVRLYELAVQYDPQFIELYVDLSSLYGAMGNLKGALDSIERGLDRNGRSARLLCNKGFLLNAMGRQREAKTVLLHAIEIDANDPLTWTNLGKSHHELGELHDARTAYINAVILDPSLEEARYNIERLKLLLDDGVAK